MSSKSFRNSSEGSPDALLSSSPLLRFGALSVDSPRERFAWTGVSPPDPFRSRPLVRRRERRDRPDVDRRCLRSRERLRRRESCLVSLRPFFSRRGGGIAAHPLAGCPFSAVPIPARPPASFPLPKSCRYRIKLFLARFSRTRGECVRLGAPHRRGCWEGGEDILGVSVAESCAAFPRPSSWASSRIRLRDSSPNFRFSTFSISPSLLFRFSCSFGRVCSSFFSSSRRARSASAVCCEGANDFTSDFRDFSALASRPMNCPRWPDGRAPLFILGPRRCGPCRRSRPLTSPLTPYENPLKVRMRPSPVVRKSFIDISISPQRGNS